MGRNQRANENKVLVVWGKIVPFGWGLEIEAKPEQVLGLDLGGCRRQLTIRESRDFREMKPL